MVSENFENDAGNILPGSFDTGLEDVLGKATPLQQAFDNVSREYGLADAWEGGAFRKPGGSLSGQGSKAYLANESDGLAAGVNHSLSAPDGVGFEARQNGAGIQSKKADPSKGHWHRRVFDDRNEMAEEAIPQESDSPSFSRSMGRAPETCAISSVFSNDALSGEAISEANSDPVLTPLGSSVLGFSPTEREARELSGADDRVWHPRGDGFGVADTDASDASGKAAEWVRGATGSSVSKARQLDVAGELAQGENYPLGIASVFGKNLWLDDVFAKMPDWNAMQGQLAMPIAAAPQIQALNLGLSGESVNEERARAPRDAALPEDYFFGGLMGSEASPRAETRTSGTVPTNEILRLYSPPIAAQQEGASDAQILGSALDTPLIGTPLGEKADEMQGRGDLASVANHYPKELFARFSEGNGPSQDSKTGEVRREGAAFSEQSGWLTALSKAIATELAGTLGEGNGRLQENQVGGRQHHSAPSGSHSDPLHVKLVEPSMAYRTHMPVVPTADLPSQSLPIPGHVMFAP